MGKVKIRSDTMRTIKGDLVMGDDMLLKESITVEGDIKGKDGRWFNLNVKGNINARNIDAGNIDALDINALDINARNIICVSREKKHPKVKTMACSIVLNRYNRKRKEVMPEKGVIENEKTSNLLPLRRNKTS